MSSHADDTTPGLIDDPDGPLLDGDAQLPILSRNPASMPMLETRRVPEWGVRFGLVCIVAVIFLPNLGSFGLWDPWETHYGEVTRNMIETNDWVHPWWGYKGEKIGGVKGPGEHFYSKPILLFWMEAATIRAIGLSEFSIRFPVALIAMLTTFAVYLTFSKMLGRWRGVSAALVLGTCPQFYFLARQAQTDMPFVGTLTIALCFFSLALFGPRERTSDKKAWGLLIGTIGVLVVIVLPQLGIITADVNHPVQHAAGIMGLANRWRYTGLWQALTYALVLLLLLVSMVQPAVRHYKEQGGHFTDDYKDRLRRQCYLWIFYIFCGLSFMSKGLLGFALPGLIIFLYLLMTNEWTLLIQKNEGKLRGRVELIRGIFIFLVVSLPWYVALLSGPEGRAFWNRFFIHDHFNRLGTGVHAIDDGTFEHFIKWLGIGMWPWVAFVPAALLPLVRYRLKNKGPINRLKLFVFLWFLTPFVLFTLSSTKFHHYIFPALPPLAILVGWTLIDLIRERGPGVRALMVVALGLFVLIGWDISREPQHLRNLFTYKYDREWPSAENRPIDASSDILFHPKDSSDWEPKQKWAEGDFYKHTPESLHAVLNAPLFRFNTWIWIVIGTGSLGLILMFGSGVLRWAGLGLLSLISVAMAIWALNYYMGMLGPHWSQKYLFDRYYDVCVRATNSPQIEESFTPLIAGNETLSEWADYRTKQVCQEEVISWLLTWRGEAFYSHNTIRPIQKEKKQMQPYLKKFNKGARFFVHIERTRAKSFKSRADSHLKKLAKNPHFSAIKEYKVTLEHNENNWFVLLKVDPVCKEGFHPDRLGRCKTAKAAATTNTLQPLLQSEPKG